MPRLILYPRNSNPCSDVHDSRLLAHAAAPPVAQNSDGRLPAPLVPPPPTCMSRPNHRRTASADTPCAASPDQTASAGCCSATAKPLRPAVSHVRSETAALAIASGLQHALNQTQHSAIRHTLGHQRHELLVIHRPEEVLQVRIHDPLTPALHLPPDFPQRILGRSPSPISEVGFIEYRLEDRFQSVQQRLLAHPIINRRNSQRTILPRLARLRNHVSPAPVAADRYPL